MAFNVPWPFAVVSMQQGLWLGELTQPSTATLTPCTYSREEVIVISFVVGAKRGLRRWVYREAECLRMARLV